MYLLSRMVIAEMTGREKGCLFQIAPGFTCFIVETCQNEVLDLTLNYGDNVMLVFIFHYESSHLAFLLLSFLHSSF
jgi:hypothetical protein